MKEIRTGDVDWPAWIEGANDLGKVAKALSRETLIRGLMTQTGESRKIVTEMVDAADSMNEEGILVLTDGEPTTLRDALNRYVGWLEDQDDNEPILCGVVGSELTALLNYPWPGEEALIELHEDNPSLRLTVQRPDDEHLVVKIGDHEVAGANHDEHGWDGIQVVEETARAVHRAVLARVIADRPHHVQLNSTDRQAMLLWLERPNGSWSPEHGGRFSLDAVEGGGVLVRTRPYKYQPAPKTLT